MKMGGECGH